MNSQTEILENRIAQIKVEVETDALEAAKRKAARSLSKRVNIPGFRKGKAPYNILTRYLGEGAILEEAIDQLGPELYREALTSSDIEPYAPGQLDDIETGENDSLVMVFSVPLVPEVELGEYREVRHDYEAPEITDDQVDEILKMLQSNKATSEVKEGAAATGDEVKLDIFGELVESEDNDDTDEESAGSVFDQKDWKLVLGEAVREPMPGFSDAIEGMTAGEERTFELVFPADDEDYEESLRGKTVNFTVTCHEVSSREVPELDDEFAKSVGEVDVETLDELTAAIREDLENNATARAESEYADTVLDKMVEGATIEFPEVMIDETIDDMIHNFEHQLERQGMNLEAYLNYSQMEKDDLRKDYREGAITRLKRSLLLGSLVEEEGLELDNRAIAKAIRDRAAAMSNGNPEIQQVFEQYLNNEQGRREVATELLTQQAFERIVAIGKGENPPTGPIPFVEEEEEVAEVETDPAIEIALDEDVEAAAETSEVEVAASEQAEDEASAEADEESAADED